jgi:hypothetical protein
MAENEMESRWKKLCQHLIDEQDPDRFEMLTSELFLMLEQRQNQLKAWKESAPKVRSA